MRWRIGLKKEVAEKISYEDFCKMFSYAFDAERVQDRDKLRKSEFERVTGRKWNEGTRKKNKVSKKVGDEHGEEAPDSDSKE